MDARILMTLLQSGQCRLHRRVYHNTIATYCTLISSFLFLLLLLCTSPLTTPLSLHDDDAPTQCSHALSSLPPHERSLFELIAEEVEDIRREAAPSSPPSEYQGRWPSSAVKRILPHLSYPTPRPVIILYGDFDVDLSILLYHLQPGALILQLSDTRKSDDVSQVKDKLARRRTAVSNRGAKDDVKIHLTMKDALCVLMGMGIRPDVVHVSPWLFPLPVACCKWWEGSVIVMGHHPGYPALDSFAVMTGRRIYSDQPVFVLSSPSSPVACSDSVGHAISPSTPLLGLYMIVKDELGGINDTMQSILPYLDGLSVLDTGSTDGTDTVIEQLTTQFSVPHAVHHGPFIDFSTTRNEALRLASQTLNTTFILMLNGDDTFIGGDQLRQFLEQRKHLCGPSDEMYLLSVDYDGTGISWSERVMRTSNHRYPDWPSSRYWHYVGVTHEIYSHDEYTNSSYQKMFAGRPAAGEDDGFRFHVHHTYKRETTEKLHARAVKDISLLLKQLERMPNDSRTMFYLSHSYDIAEDYENAYYWHKRRTEHIVNLFHTTSPSPVASKEECTCLLRLGQLSAFRLKEQHGWKEAERWFELARSVCWDQIESRFYLAQRWLRDGEVEKGWRMVEEAEELRKTGVGLAYVYDNEIVSNKLPQLYEWAKQRRREETGQGIGEAGKKERKTKGKRRSKDEL